MVLQLPLGRSWLATDPGAGRFAGLHHANRLSPPDAGGPGRQAQKVWAGAQAGFGQQDAGHWQRMAIKGLDAAGGESRETAAGSMPFLDKGGTFLRYRSSVGVVP
jgi:hypothetical protein